MTKYKTKIEYDLIFITPIPEKDIENGLRAILEKDGEEDEVMTNIYKGVFTYAVPPEGKIKKVWVKT